MAFVSELFDQMRDLLNDASDTQVPFATKKLYLNRGIARMWPRIFSVRTATITFLADTTELALTAAIAEGLILSVEREVVAGEGWWIPYEAYDIRAGDEDLAGVITLPYNSGPGFDLRIKYVAAVPLIAAASYTAAQSETWTGPDRAMGLPVLYAMGMAVARKLDDRQDTSRYSTTQALNGVTDQDIMGASQMWFGQFEAELAELERPLPISKL